MPIGFHTCRHHYLPLLENEELPTALEEGRAELEELTGPLTVVAYPHGAADERVAAAARAAGFAVGYTGAPTLWDPTTIRCCSADSRPPTARWDNSRSSSSPPSSARAAE
jgi:peptidoglycan/xylan/chitin deacetylase (PgdA/CDA1 family)